MSESPVPLLHIHPVPKVSKKRTRRPRVDVSPLASLRGVLTVAGDIRSDIQFQNDVNALLAAVSRLSGVSQSPEVTRMPGAELGMESLAQAAAAAVAAASPPRRRRLLT